MSSELAYEASDEASESELLERSLSVWKGWNSIEWEDFAPTVLDIHTASSIGHYEWVRSIILKGEDPALDRRNLGGWTPLMYACYIGHDNIVNLLINAGCNMNMKNSRGHTPLMLAASCGNESVARTLVRRGAELELIDKTGWTALFHATYAGHQNFVAFLLEAGANKDAIEPSSGTTPFMEAAAEGHEIIVQLFLQHGVNVNAKAHNGDMARSLALMNGHIKVVSLMDNHVLPLSYLRSEPGLDFYLSSSDETQPRKLHPSARNLRLKSQGPSIRDGPEAIARMIDRTHNTDTVAYPNLLVPKGYVSFPVSEAAKEETKMSYRDVTSPINPEDYKDSSGSRAMSDLDDFNDDSNAFTKTGAITIKSSSSSSGGLIAALGLSRAGSLDSDDSHLCVQTGTSSDDILEYKVDSGRVRGTASNDKTLLTDQDSKYRGGYSPFSERENMPDSDIMRLSPLNINREGYIKESVDVNIEQQDSGIVSPLRDYFPLDSSFNIGTTAAQPSEPGAVNGKPQLESSPLPSSHLTLPKDNMTQVEIVNRFLKNLTMNNPETSPGQNRWADEACADHPPGYEVNGTHLYPHHMEGHSSTTSAFETTTASVRKPFLSKSTDLRGVENRIKDNVLSQEFIESKTGLSKHQVNELPSAHLGEVVESTPGFSSYERSSTGHLFLRSNLHHHQKENQLEIVSNQPWTHHSQLNHHHRLHSRRHHNHKHLSHLTDSTESYVRNTPARLDNTHMPSPQPSVVNCAEMSAPFVHDRPQDYFYSDIKTASHFHQHVFGAISGAAVHSPTPVLNTAVSHVDYSAKLATSPNPLSHLISPVADSTVRNLHGSTERVVPAGMSESSQVLTDQVNCLISQHITFPQSVNQAALKSKDSNFIQQLPASSSVATIASSALNYHQLPYRLPSQHIPPQSSVPATVIIPGHTTSQPVCDTIGWDNVMQPENLGPRDLAEMLTQLGLIKYLETFEEQDVDLQVFLSLTDNDLKELGIKLFGPRKKMTNAIARWHSNAPIACNSLEQAYADRLEGEMQEMAIQLNQAYENEERLKAQVLQEQQLRSVTESCLMEERASWEQARQILLNTRAKMRTMGDLMSRLRLFHKELRKQLDEVSKQLTAENVNEDSRQASKASRTSEQVADQSYHMANENCMMIGESGREIEYKLGNSVSNFCIMGSELFKKSEKCIKEMQQTLTNLVLGAEHLLKSTHNLNNIDKDRT